MRSNKHFRFVTYNVDDFNSNDFADRIHVENLVQDIIYLILTVKPIARSDKKLIIKFKGEFT